jgi:hypothetical protein
MGLIGGQRARSAELEQAREFQRQQQEDRQKHAMSMLGVQYDYNRKAAAANAAMAAAQKQRDLQIFLNMMDGGSVPGAGGGIAAPPMAPGGPSPTDVALQGPAGDFSSTMDTMASTPVAGNADQIPGGAFRTAAMQAYEGDMGDAMGTMQESQERMQDLGIDQRKWVTSTEKDYRREYDTETSGYQTVVEVGNRVKPYVEKYNKGELITGPEANSIIVAAGKAADPGNAVHIGEAVFQTASQNIGQLLEAYTQAAKGEGGFANPVAQSYLAELSNVIQQTAAAAQGNWNNTRDRYMGLVSGDSPLLRPYQVVESPKSWNPFTPTLANVNRPTVRETAQDVTDTAVQKYRDFLASP